MHAGTRRKRFVVSLRVSGAVISAVRNGLALADQLAPDIGYRPRPTMYQTSWMRGIGSVSAPPTSRSSRSRNRRKS